MSSCGDDGPATTATGDGHAEMSVVERVAVVEMVSVVSVTSQRCHRPTRHHGVGTVVGADPTGAEVLTAAHVVDGDLRLLQVDGADAEVVALDRGLDLALVRVVGDPPPSVGAVPPAVSDHTIAGALAIVTPDGRHEVETHRRVTLRVRDVTDGVTHERPAIELAGAVERGASGAPVVDTDGSVLAVVVLSDPLGDVTFAVAVPRDLDALPVAVRRGCDDT